MYVLGWKRHFVLYIHNLRGQTTMFITTNAPTQLRPTASARNSFPLGWMVRFQLWVHPLCARLHRPGKQVAVNTTIAAGTGYVFGAIFIRLTSGHFDLAKVGTHTLLFSSLSLSSLYILRAVANFQWHSLRPRYCTVDRR